MGLTSPGTFVLQQSPFPNCGAVIFSKVAIWGDHPHWLQPPVRLTPHNQLQTPTARKRGFTEPDCPEIHTAWSSRRSAFPEVSCANIRKLSRALSLKKVCLPAYVFNKKKKKKHSASWGDKSNTRPQSRPRSLRAGTLAGLRSYVRFRYQVSHKPRTSLEQTRAKENPGPPWTGEGHRQG